MLEGLIARTRNPERLAEREAELECPPFPEALAYIWSAFCRLSARRSVGFSINPISWPDIDAFVRHSKMPLAPWEIRLIEELDDLFRQEHSKPRD
jgi:hypothetical protein